MKNVTLDPGHGGHDYGAGGHGLYEKNIVLDISLETERILLEEYENVRVFLTRRDDRYLTLQQRVDISNRNKSDLFVSVHVNSAKDPSANGYESFASTGTKAYGNLTNIHLNVYREFAKFNVRDRGFKRLNFYVIRYTNAPAILTENLFIVNKREANILRDKRNIRAIARAHAEGIASFLKLKKKKKTNEGELTMSQYLELKKEIEELKKGPGLTDVQKGDMKVFLQKAYDSGLFSVNHSGSVENMRQKEALGLALSYLGRLAKADKLPK